jgi:hypothetical protein
MNGYVMVVGALLKCDSIPERALLHAKSNATICLSADVASEIREVFSRPKFQKYLVAGRRELLLDIIENGALPVGLLRTRLFLCLSRLRRSRHPIIPVGLLFMSHSDP